MTTEHEETNINDSTDDDDSGSCKVISSSRRNGQQRQIGYAILSGGGKGSDVAVVNNKNNTGICYFYPLSGCSAGAAAYLKSSVLTKFSCRVLVVDRPSIGATSDLLPPLSSAKTADTAAAAPSPQHDHHSALLHRIHGHVQDFLEVLQAEGIEHVYVYGVCIGHPYAVELCRQLLQQRQQQRQTSSPAADSDQRNSSLPTTTTTTIQLHGLTLVAPFVSTACPASWRLARLGAAVPNAVLTSVVRSTMSIVSTILPHVLRPGMLKRLIPLQEQNDFGWTQDDFETLCNITVKVKNESSNRAKTAEAQLGVTPIWQAEVCDKFATESGCGLVLDDDDDDNDTDAAVGCCSTNSTVQGSTTAPTTTSMKPQPLIPIRIHASPHDKLATPASLEWMARRCYGSGDDDGNTPSSIIMWHENIYSHESMTFFGGPPHNPSLLLQAAREWGLLLATED
jgi:hypothetical protein